MKNNYDRVAGFYDMLSKLVFGNTLMEAQRSVLHFIPEGAKILVAGGGTGAILEEISQIRPYNIDITYIEISQKMLDIAKRRDVGKNNVQYMHEAVESFHSVERFDMIITSFLFDNFKQDNAEIVFKNLDNKLHSKGFWLFTDFNVENKPGKFWQKWLLKSMYLFFGILSDVEAKKLPDTEMLFSKAGFKTVFQKSFYSGFIQSLVYQKP
ncbi:bifunctional 2-polyprenyl-6-hydroxyphenol methylase/3-demethylubiquinol 3-O-methyltransferase UbiG [Dyadobacter sp. CY347]|uniref:class I SAM-dependent methyltransferase n=1 Tax=Dyadobacter sp. CY347 TaxID=2909336 RepID=UPI001F3455C5|nr:methyltransferase domain-containing protein [Dyadobacter sp. CY347]MCF2486915.1 methyltransferase domain-containing protein [Dyadobacter sp. CY347]